MSDLFFPRARSRAAPVKATLAPRPGPLQEALNAIQPQPPPRGLVLPEREYVILFTPRSGSSHLAQVLASAGLADPREWLHPDFLTERAEKFGTNTFEGYFDALRARCSRNGVFGHKMALNFYDRFSQEVRLEDHFDFGAPAIVLYRENILQQAVSLALAEQRGFWHDTGQGDSKAVRRAAYDGAAIARSLDWIAGLELLTDGFIAGKRMPVRYISYETLTSAPLSETVQAIARHLDLQADCRALGSDHRKLGGPANLDHVARFVREDQARVACVLERRQGFLKRAASSLLL